MRVETGIIDLRARKGPGAPIGFLVALIDPDPELLREHIVQADEGIAEHARRVHRIEEIRELKAEIPLQTDEVVFRSMENLFGLGILE
jgi:hypothetical protein